MNTFRARTRTEAYDYMRLAVGEPCRDHALVYRPVSVDLSARVDRPVVVTRLECPQDDRRWEFSFTKDQDAPADGPLRSVYGYGPEPSTLIDAGEFAWLILLHMGQAEAARSRFPGGLPDLETASDIVTWLERSREAAVEVKKFIPAGEEEVPESAIWSPLGREVWQWRRHELNRATMDAGIEQVELAIAGYTEIYT